MKIRAMPSGFPKVADELIRLRNGCLDGSVWTNQCEIVGNSYTGVDPHSVSNLLDYTVAVLREIRGDRAANDKSKRDILAYWLGFKGDRRDNGNVVRLTNVQIAQKTGFLHGESVRMVKSHLSGEPAKSCFAPFLAAVRDVLGAREGVISKEALGEGLDRTLNWQGTTCFSVCAILENLEIQVEQYSDRIAVPALSSLSLQRFQSFVECLKACGCDQDDFAYENLMAKGESNGLDNLTQNEYMFFGHKVVKEFGTLGLRRIVKERLSQRFGLKTTLASSRQAIFERIVLDAGRDGLTEDEILAKCKEKDGSLSWTKSNCRSAREGLRGKVLVLERGSNGRGFSRYVHIDAFSEYFAFVNHVGKELRTYMDRNGFGLLNTWSKWAEVTDTPHFEQIRDIEFDAFYEVMRAKEAGGLYYCNHRYVALPEFSKAIDKCGESRIRHLCAAETYQYFARLNCLTVQKYQVIKFLRECLGLNFGTAQHMVNDDCVMELERLPDIDIAGSPMFRFPADRWKNYPNLLTDRVRPSLAFTVERNVDESGRAKTIGTYVKLFMRQIENSGFKFSSEELANLADVRWCHDMFGVRKSILVEVHGDRPTHTYWNTTIVIGDKEYWVNSVWPHKSKEKFDAWATEIARRAGFEFAPYDVTKDCELNVSKL